MSNMKKEMTTTNETKTQTELEIENEALKELNAELRLLLIGQRKKIITLERKIECADKLVKIASDPYPNRREVGLSISRYMEE